MQQASSQNNRMQTIKHKKKEYQLRVTYKSGIIDAEDGHNQSLDIFLKTNNEKSFHTYKLFYTNLTIPEQIMSAFSEMEIVFQCFRDQEGFDIDQQGGKIKIKTQFEVKGRKFKRNCTLNTQKFEVTEFQVMFQHIKQLQQEVNRLKLEKEAKQEELRKIFQQKYDEQKRKFDSIIRQKQIEEIKHKRLQQQLQMTVDNLYRQVKDLSQRVKSLNDYNMGQLKELNDKSIVCEKQLKKTRDQLEDILMFKQGIQTKKKLKPIGNNQNIQQNRDKVRQTPITSNNKSFQHQKHKKITDPCQIDNEGPSFVYGKSPYIEKFKIKQNQITYIGQQKQTQLLFKPAIPHTRFNFQFTIVKTASRAIMIGIVDINESLKHRHSDKKSASYWGKTGYIWGPGKFQGDGFCQGDTVRVTVDIDKGIIEWRVNGVLSASWKPDFFQSKSRLIVPFIEMEHSGDTVRWNKV